MTKNSSSPINCRSINTKVNHSKKIPFHTEILLNILHNLPSNHELPFKKFPILSTINISTINSTRAKQKNDKYKNPKKYMYLETTVSLKTHHTNLVITIPNSSTIN